MPHLREKCGWDKVLWVALICLICLSDIVSQTYNEHGEFNGVNVRSKNVQFNVELSSLPLILGAAILDFENMLFSNSGVRNRIKVCLQSGLAYFSK